MSSWLPDRLSFRHVGRRSKLEAHIDVLSVIAEGAAKPTHIMYKANLSWATTQSHLHALIAQGLVLRKSFGGRQLYELTDKGMRVLSYFFKVKQELGPRDFRAESQFSLAEAR